jgi:hypothetical protein
VCGPHLSPPLCAVLPPLAQTAAVLAMSLVTMGEELGVDMTSRMAEHLLQVRKIPLAWGGFLMIDRL